MTATVTEYDAAPLRERLTAVLAALDLTPPGDCRDCRRRADGWCPPCAQARSDSALVSKAIREIDRPQTGRAEALRLYAKCWLLLTGLELGEFTAALSGGAL
jgi:hypothetical protein